MIIRNRRSGNASARSFWALTICLLLSMLLPACNRPAAVSPRLTPPEAATQPWQPTATSSPESLTASPPILGETPLQVPRPSSTATPGGKAGSPQLPTGTASTAPPSTPTASLPPVSVKCSPTSTGVQRCKDTLLNITFEYPSAWGRLAYFLNYARSGGLEYYYGFSQAPASLLWAGGMSQDYILPPGETPLGWFTGFHGLDEAAYCREIKAAVCQELGPGVLQVVRLPGAHEICSSDPAALLQPQYELLVDLPDNPAISGFMLQAYFLSPAALQTLWAPLNIQEGIPAGQCDDPQARRAFDVQVGELLRQLQSGSLTDEASQTALETLQHLAGSVIRQ